MGIIGTFYIMTTFLGFGAATIVGKSYIAQNGGTNMSAPLLAQALAGDIFFAFISAIAFATILAVVAGLTISASTSFAHDLYTNVLHHGELADPQQEVKVARITAFVVGAVAIAVAILLGPTFNVAFLVALAFAVAASANLPVILLSIFWKRFTTEGAVWGLATGLVSSLALIVISPSIMGLDGKHLIHAAPIFPLENPGIVSIPLGFLGAFFGTLASRVDDHAEAKFTELEVRANTGLGARTSPPPLTKRRHAPRASIQRPRGTVFVSRTEQLPRQPRASPHHHPIRRHPLHPRLLRLQHIVRPILPIQIPPLTIRVHQRIHLLRARHSLRQPRQKIPRDLHPEPSQRLVISALLAIHDPDTLVVMHHARPHLRQRIFPRIRDEIASRYGQVRAMPPRHPRKRPRFKRNQNFIQRLFGHMGPLIVQFTS